MSRRDVEERNLFSRIIIDELQENETKTAAVYDLRDEPSHTVPPIVFNSQEDLVASVTSESLVLLPRTGNLGTIVSASSGDGFYSTNNLFT